MDFKNRWLPVSSYSYAPSAVFVPEKQENGTLELILGMYQNYPEYKVLPIQDFFHGYISGYERFVKTREMQCTAWETAQDYSYWSNLCFPDESDHQVFAKTIFHPEKDALVIDLELNNPSDFSRQWEFSLFAAPCEGVELPEHQADLNGFKIGTYSAKFRMDGIVPESVTEVNSNFWLEFPFNAEMNETPDNPRNRLKKRIKYSFRWIDIPPQSRIRASITVQLSGSVTGKNAPFIREPRQATPYEHLLWETRQNFHLHDGKLYPIPAAQWGVFYIWDTGMTALGTVHNDPEITRRIISAMPDPEHAKGTGSYIITAVYALHEYYTQTGDLEFVRKHFDRLLALVMGVFDSPDGIATADRGTGADDSPVLFYAKAMIFSWDFRKTLPVNPEHKRKQVVSPGLTAHGICQLKILKNFAVLLEDHNRAETLDSIIAEKEKILHTRCFNAEKIMYFERFTDPESFPEMEWSYNYFPLLSGSVPESYTAELLRKAEQYRTQNGFVIIPPGTEYYREEGYPNGSVWPPLQYFFWKIFLSHGMFEQAKQTAETYFRIYEQNHLETLCCWEQFRVNTGKGAGNSRFSGFVVPILAMYHAHRTKGYLQTGFQLLAIEKSLTDDGAELHFLAAGMTGKTGAFSIVLEPDTEYKISDGQIIRSDKYGWLPVSLRISQEMFRISIVRI